MISRALILVALLTLPAYSADFKGACTAPAHCDTATVIDKDGHTSVTFSNGLTFAGDRIGGDGPLFFLKAGSNGACHFYFTDHGTFTPGWESRLTVIECPHLQFTVAPSK